MNPRTVIVLRRLLLTLALLWLVMLTLDIPIALAMHRWGVDATIKGRWYAELLKAPGFFGVAAPVVAMLGVLKKLRWRDVGVVILSMAASGLNVLLKWAVGRSRPFHVQGISGPGAFVFRPFWHGVYGLFHQTNLSFPSGHACMAAAGCGALAIIRPAWAKALAAAAVCTAIERAAENAHYASDAVAALIVGLATAWAFSAALQRPSTGPLE